MQFFSTCKKSILFGETPLDFNPVTYSFSSSVSTIPRICLIYHAASVSARTSVGIMIPFTLTEPMTGSNFNFMDNPYINRSARKKEGIDARRYVTKRTILSSQPSLCFAHKTPSGNAIRIVAASAVTVKSSVAGIVFSTRLPPVFRSYKNRQDLREKMSKAISHTAPKTDH